MPGWGGSILIGILYEQSIFSLAVVLGDIVVVDVDGKGDDANFTFAGNAKTSIPDALPAAG